MGEACGMHGEESITYIKDRNYLENYTEVNLKETEWESMDWINLARDTDTWQSVVQHGNKASGAIKCREFLH
jgi:hypothetical protein